MKPSYRLPWMLAVLGHAVLAWPVLTWPRKAETARRADFVAEGGLVSVSAVDGVPGGGDRAAGKVEDVPEEAVNKRAPGGRAEDLGRTTVMLVKHIKYVLMMKRFALSAADRTNEEFGVELIEVAADGTARIRATGTGEILSAKPGECFQDGPFGQNGLVLISDSVREQRAVFDRTWCETVEEK